MIIDEIKQAYEFINKRTVFTNINHPINYNIPKIKGIHFKEYGKNIKEVYPNTLKYIIYNLHNIDYSFLIETIVALFYYYKFRKQSEIELNQVYKDIINHYSILYEKQMIDYKEGECIYLIEINIGSSRLYKVGKTSDFNLRMRNLASEISKKYQFVNTSINPLNVVYTSISDELEKKILNEIDEKKHGFYFKGHTESFKNIEIINIFNKNKELNSKNN